MLPVQGQLAVRVDPVAPTDRHVNLQVEAGHLVRDPEAPRARGVHELEDPVRRVPAHHADAVLGERILRLGLPGLAVDERGELTQIVLTHG